MKVLSTMQRGAVGPSQRATCRMRPNIDSRRSSFRTSYNRSSDRSRCTRDGIARMKPDARPLISRMCTDGTREPRRVFAIRFLQRQGMEEVGLLAQLGAAFQETVQRVRALVTGWSPKATRTASPSCGASAAAPADKFAKKRAPGCCGTGHEMMVCRDLCEVMFWRQHPDACQAAFSQHIEHILDHESSVQTEECLPTQWRLGRGCATLPRGPLVAAGKYEHLQIGSKRHGNGHRLDRGTVRNFNISRFCTWPPLLRANGWSRTRITATFDGSCGSDSQDGGIDR